MSQNTEQNVRTRDAQVGAIANDWIVTGMGRDVAHEWAVQMVKEAEARGAEEQRRKDAELSRDDLAALVEGMSVSIDVSTGEDDVGNRLFGTVDETQYHSGDKHNLILLVTDPKPNFKAADVPALEARIAELEEAEQLARADAEASKARVKVLEAENAVLQARKIGAAPEPVPYSDPIQTMSTEQLCQRLQVLRARWDELMDSDEEMGGGSPMESMDEEMQSLENEISRRAALTREGGV